MDFLISIIYSDVSEVVPTIFEAFNNEKKHFDEKFKELQKELKIIRNNQNEQMINPIKTGLVYMEEASFCYDDKALQNEYIWKAIHEFISVSKMDSLDLPLVPVKASFYVGVCYYLLERKKISQKWFEKSYCKGLKIKSEIKLEIIAIISRKGRLGLKKEQKAQMERYKKYSHELNAFLNSMVKNHDYWCDKREILISYEDLLCSFDNHSKNVTAINFSPCGQFLASASKNNEIIMWNISTGDKEFEIKDHLVKNTCSTFSSDNSFFASGEKDCSISLWDISKKKFLRSIKGHEDQIRSLCFSNDAKLIASGANDNLICVWDVYTGRLKCKFEGHWGHYSGLNCVDFSPDGSMVAGGSDDFTVTIWDIVNKKKRHHLTKHNDRVKYVSFSPNGAFLVSGADDGNVRIWNVNSGSLYAEFMEHSSSITAVRFSPKSDVLATGSFDSLHLWDVEKKKKIKTLIKKNASIDDLDFSYDGKFLVNNSSNDIMLWDIHSKKRLCNAREGGLLASINKVQFSRDGLFFASCSSDKKVKIYSMQFRIANMGIVELS